VSGDDEHHDHSHHEKPSSRRPRSEFELRTMALEAALVEKGVIATDVVDAFVETIETRMGPHQGARVVAKAWVDPAFKQRLLEDAPSAIGELGIAGPQTDDLRVVENTPEVHNLVVCTLCSCYPWAVLGLPPAWYKDFAYRSRAVAEPRAVLAEFGTNLDPGVEVRVWDSSASTRYLVLPERPSGTDDLDEDGLADLVTRDTMIGVTKLADLT
jgi:nitrile hydratase